MDTSQSEVNASTLEDEFCGLVTTFRELGDRYNFIGVSSDQPWDCYVDSSELVLFYQENFFRITGSSGNYNLIIENNSRSIFERIEQTKVEEIVMSFIPNLQNEDNMFPLDFFDNLISEYIKMAIEPMLKQSGYISSVVHNNRDSSSNIVFSIPLKKDDMFEVYKMESSYKLKLKIKSRITEYNTTIESGNTIKKAREIIKKYLENQHL